MGDSQNTKTPPPLSAQIAPPKRRLALIIVGLAGIATMALIIINVGNISGFAVKAINANPRWLGGAALSQLITYGCVALVWSRILNSMNYHLSFLRLYPLAVAKMFSDQAIPSGGVAGAAFLFHALGRRGIPNRDAFTVFSFTAITFLAAFLSAAMISLAAVAAIDDVSSTLSTSIAAFAAIVLFFIFCISVIMLTNARLPKVFHKIPHFTEFSEWVLRAKDFVVAQRGLFAEATLIQFIVRLFDGLTLFLIVLAIGADTAYTTCFFAVVIASVAATVAPMPMGLGTFEAGMIASLNIFGMPLDEALTATLLFRGLSLWLPLAPGFYFVQREVLRAKANKPPQLPS